MKKHLKIALQMLGEATRNTCDPWNLSGKSNASIRQAVMRQLMGENVPKAKCGVNALIDEFAEQLKIARTSQIHVVRQMRYMNDITNKKWDASRVWKERPLVRVRGHGLGRTDHPWLVDLSENSDQPVCVTYGIHNTEMVIPPDRVAASLNKDEPLAPLNERKV